MLADPDLALDLRLLESVGMAQADDERLDPSVLAKEFGHPFGLIETRLEHLEACGLILSGLSEGLSPILREAGHQYLTRGGNVAPEVLSFLPRVVDDLDARAALLAAGTVMVDEFRAALVSGNAVDHARELVPDAFVAAVDERLAVDLFAASVALMARLSAGEPAGSVAEEVVAIELMSQAEAWLELRRDEGDLDETQFRASVGELTGLFELFQDDDVLGMFEMTDPADAALANHDPINDQMGVVDQRLEAWCAPFGWTAPTGYLHGPRPSA